jgi:flagellar basal-body rod modification protein FlgD
MTSPIAAVGIVPTSTSTAATQAASSSKSLLDPQAFLQLLVAQLQYQDPSSPVDTSTFMNQTATLSQVQTMNSMSSSLESLMHMQQVQAATSMLGKSVTFTDSAGTTHTGVVSGVSGASSNVTLTVGNASVGLDTVTEIHTASA